MRRSPERARLALCNIRPIAAGEEAELESTVVAAYAEFRGCVPALIFDAYIADLRRVAADADDAEVIVAEHNGCVAGGVVFYADASSEGLGLPKGWAGFRRLAVHPEMRGLGIGRSLVDECVALARKLGARTIGIHTAAFMTAACGIYEEAGFRRAPPYDLRASEILGLDEPAGDVAVIAYRLDLDRNASPMRT